LPGRQSDRLVVALILLLRRGGAGSEGAGLLVALFVSSTSGCWEERHGWAEA
jgi:hypothetical protein